MCLELLCVHLEAGRGSLQRRGGGGVAGRLTEGAERRQAERKAFKAGYCLIRCCSGITTVCLSPWVSAFPREKPEAQAGHRPACQESKKASTKKENGARDYTSERQPPPNAAAYCDFKDKSLIRELSPLRRVGLNQRDQESLWRELRVCVLGLTPPHTLNPRGGGRTETRAWASAPPPKHYRAVISQGNLCSQAKLMSHLRGTITVKGGQTSTRTDIQPSEPKWPEQTGWEYAW